MTSSDLLVSVRDLPRREQARLAIAWAREHSPAELAALSRRSGEGRRLAMIAAGALPDVGYLASALRDYDPVWWIRALRASRPVDDRVVAEAVVAAPEKLRGQACRFIREDGRRSLAETLVDRIPALLPACGPSTVARVLPGILDQVGDWSRLFDRHPGLTLDILEARFARDEAFARRFPFKRLVESVGTLPADRVALLIERYHAGRPVYWEDGVKALAKADPALAARLLAGELRGSTAPLTAPALRRILRWDPAAAPRVVTDRWQVDTLLLRDLPWPLRERVFDGSVADSPAMLARLPRARAAREARRTLATPRVRDDRRLAWRVAAFLPLDEAAAILVPGTRMAGDEDRLLAYELLVACAARHGETPETLRATARLDRLRTEVDTVLLGALAALGDRPPRLLTGIFGDDLLPVLDRVAAGAFARRNRHVRHDWPWLTNGPATIRQLDALVAGLLAQVDDCPPDLAGWLRTTASWMATRWPGKDLRVTCL